MPLSFSPSHASHNIIGHKIISYDIVEGINCMIMRRATLYIANIAVIKSQVLAYNSYVTGMTG